MADNQQSDNRKVYLPPINIGSKEGRVENRDRYFHDFALSPKKRATKSNQSSVSDSCVLPRIKGSSEFESPLCKSQTLMELHGAKGNQSSMMTTSKSWPVLTRRNFDPLALTNAASVDFTNETAVGPDAGLGGFRASKTRTMAKRPREEVNGGGLKLPLICLSSSTGITNQPNFKRNSMKGAKLNPVNVPVNHRLPDSLRFESRLSHNEMSPHFMVGGSSEQAINNNKVGSGQTAAEDINSNSNDKNQAKRSKNVKVSNS